LADLFGLAAAFGFEASLLLGSGYEEPQTTRFWWA